MKTRSGFVSNSSSSSFIVAVRSWHQKPGDPDHVPADKVQLLKDHGFLPSETPFPSRMNTFSETPEGWISPWYRANQKPGEEYYLGYYVICNQDEVVEFLLKNDIPFTASVHYHNETYAYDAKSEQLVILYNPGRGFEGSDESKAVEFARGYKSPAYRIYTKEEWLKDNPPYVETYEDEDDEDDDVDSVKGWLCVPVDLDFCTNGTGLWTSVKKTNIHVTQMSIAYVDRSTSPPEFGELRVYFDTTTWNTHKDGLIYTDPLFMEQLRAFCAANGLVWAGEKKTALNYSEQGMQGFNYVSCDIGPEFIKSWIAKYGEL